MFTSIPMSSSMRSRLGVLLLTIGVAASPACKPKDPPASPEPAPAPANSPEPAAPVAQREYPDPPPPSQPKPFEFPNVETFTLPNQLVVYVVENHEVPLVSGQLVIRAGEMDANMVAGFTAAMLGEGTKTRSKAKIDEAIEFVGGSIGSGSTVHATYVFSSVLKNDLKLALTLMADEVLNPTFPPDALAKQKEQAKTALSANKANPRMLADTLFNMTAYPEGHPYGQPWPSAEQIDAVTVDDLKKFHETFYRSNNAFLVLAGDVNRAEAEALVKRAFKDWKPAPEGALPANPLNKYSEYSRAEKLVVHLVDRPASAQSDIIIGNLAVARGHDDWVEMAVANAVFGADPSSRLFRDIREEKGLTYNVSSDVSEGQAPGVFYIATQTRTKTTGDMVAALFGHIEDYRNKGPSDEEVQAAVDRMIGKFALDIETPAEIAEKMRTSLIYNLPPEYWSSYRDQLAAVKPDEVRRVAKAYMHPVPHVVVVGKAKKIEEQIKKALPKAEIVKYDADLKRM